SKFSPVPYSSESRFFRARFFRAGPGRLARRPPARHGTSRRSACKATGPGSSKCGTPGVPGRALSSV
ncbi:unnamed protein product, partial [Sphagnum jensenii]